MVDTMRAERFYADSKTIAVEDIPVPEPGPGEVLVKVAFCGICHSDLSLINGIFPAQQPVVTQGHEASVFFDQPTPGDIGYRTSISAYSREVLAATFNTHIDDLPDFPFTKADPLIVGRRNPLDR
jgi:hypothetical protein